MRITELEISGYERIIQGVDHNPKMLGYDFCGFLVIHNTNLGPAIGGCRYYDYNNGMEQLEDAFRLAKGMTYKNALAGLNMGGGKATVQAYPKTDLFWKNFAEMVNYLDGMYITGCDMGVTTVDLKKISEYTDYVAYGKYDSGIATAYGIIHSFFGLTEFLKNIGFYNDRTVAIQGLGKVGLRILHFLCSLHRKDLIAERYHGLLPKNFIVSDKDRDLAHEIVKRYEKNVAIVAVPPEDIYSVKCDVFMPCAMGGIINTANISIMQCNGIVGGANNQLKDNIVLRELKDKNIWYVPDYLANAGGVIILEQITRNKYIDLEYSDPKVKLKLEKLYDLTKTVLRMSSMCLESTLKICDEMSEDRLFSSVPNWHKSNWE